MMGKELFRGAEDVEENSCLARMGRKGELLRVPETRETLEVMVRRSSKVEIFNKYFCCRPGKQQCYISVS